MNNMKRKIIYEHDVDLEEMKNTSEEDSEAYVSNMVAKYEKYLRQQLSCLYVEAYVLPKQIINYQMRTKMISIINQIDGE